ncbi:MAG: hypothetical protein WA364_07200, partial [Candidatus Nitrosopolaris sp.]
TTVAVAAQVVLLTTAVPVMTKAAQAAQAMTTAGQAAKAMTTVAQAALNHYEIKFCPVFAVFIYQ